MKAAKPTAEIKCWKNNSFPGTIFSGYRLLNHSFPKHFHEHYVIEAVVSGADKFFCNGKTHTATAHEIVFINPGEVHTGSTILHNELHYYSITPAIKELQKIAVLLEKALPADFSFEQSLTNKPQLAQKMLLLFKTMETFGANCLQAEELFLDFMNEVLDCANKNSNTEIKSSKDKRVVQLINWIHSSFQEQLSLQQMAAYINVSVFHLLRIFKAATGLSPYEYLLILRMEHAKQLLQHGSSVQNAAWSAGFYDASHFNRLFRKLSGANPKNFRLYK